MSGRHLNGNVERPRPEPGEVLVWHFNHSDYNESEIAELSKVLSTGERERADRFHFDKDRRQFSVARSCLRILLGDYLKEAPDKVQIELGAFGKPYLKPVSRLAAGDLFFNVAHSAEHILIAFSSTVEIGVDIEAMRLSESRMRPLIRKICTDYEKRLVEAMDSSEVELALTRLWTAKEAALKAIGSGFQIPPDQVEIERGILEGGGDCSAATSSAFESGREGEVVLFPMTEFEVEFGCSAAVAVKGGVRSISIRRRKARLLE